MSAAGGVLVARSHRFAWGSGTAPVLMAVLNTTPDSFSDGGIHSSCDAAIAHGKRCIHEGAGIVDVGGESTRPGAARVDSAEQIARTQPVIAALAPLGPISIDTTRAEVARAALAAGQRSWTWLVPPVQPSFSCIGWHLQTPIVGVRNMTPVGTMAMWCMTCVTGLVPAWQQY